MKSSSPPVSSGLAWVPPQSASWLFSWQSSWPFSWHFLRGLLGSLFRGLLRSFPCSRFFGCLLHCGLCFGSGFSLRFCRFLLRRLLLVLRHRISPLSSIGCLTRPPSSMNLWGLATHTSTPSNRTLKKLLYTPAQPPRLLHLPSLSPPRPPLRPGTRLLPRSLLGSSRPSTLGAGASEGNSHGRTSTVMIAGRLSAPFTLSGPAMSITVSVNWNDFGSDTGGATNVALASLALLRVTR